jgi:hypothetical protein
MARNNLEIFRRHLKACTTPESCKCPFAANGYLAKWVDAKGKQIRIKNRAIGTTDENRAKIIIGKLLEAETLPKEVVPVVEAPATEELTVEKAVKEFLDDKRSSPIEKCTVSRWTFLLQERLVPWCREHNITLMDELKNRVTCQRFVNSWRVRRGDNVDAKLHPHTGQSELTRFKLFLNTYEIFGANMIKIVTPKKVINQTEEDRHGFTKAEYAAVLAGVPSYVPARQRAELLASLEFMRWTGARISDTSKLRRDEIKRNLAGDGWVADFIQMKTGKRCTPPVPDWVYDLVMALPTGGDKFFTWSRYGMFRRLIKLFTQVKTKSHMTPHCLRHTAAILGLEDGMSIEAVSMMLGHESVKVTMKTYARPLDTTNMQRDRMIRESQLRQRAAG